jgi:hypothetical protein
MRYINALIDYKNIKRLHKGQKLFMANPYNLSFIRTDESKGVITVVPNLTYRIEVSDFMGNTTIVSIPISYDASAPVIEELQCRIILLRSVKIIVLLKQHVRFLSRWYLL